MAELDISNPVFLQPIVDVPSAGATSETPPSLASPKAKPVLVMRTETVNKLQALRRKSLMGVQLQEASAEKPSPEAKSSLEAPM